MDGACVFRAGSTLARKHRLAALTFDCGVCGGVVIECLRCNRLVCKGCDGQSSLRCEAARRVSPNKHGASAMQGPLSARYARAYHRLALDE